MSLARAGLEQAVARAQEGDRAALEEVVEAIRDDVYRLSLRFLWHPQDAEDAAQEILVRVVTRLSSFAQRSAFSTWVYRVACNHLLTLRRRRAEAQAMTPAEFAEDLGHGLSDAPPPDYGVEHDMLLEETKIGCTLAMLLCLDRPQRIAYILGEILELDHREAAEVLDLTPAAYRKRLSRARTTIEDLMRRRCGIVEPENACRCSRRVETAVRQGRVDPHELLFVSSAQQAERYPAVLETIRSLEESRRAAALYRSHELPRPGEDFTAFVRDLVASI